MAKSRAQGFWAGGCASYLRSLRKEELKQFQALQAALDTETDPSLRRLLERRIAEIRAEFKRKRNSAGANLFLKT